MSEEELELGYTVKVVSRGQSIRKVRYICDNCGDVDSIERRYFCTWDVQNQQWVPAEPDCDVEDFCNNCDEYTDFEQKNI